MTSLGTLFPESFKNDFSKRTIEPGAVLRISVGNTNPPKIKRLVVLAINENKACVGYLFINSNINPNYFPSPELRALHLQFEVDGRAYLTHDSFLDCSDIKDIDLARLTEIVANDPSQHIGNLNEEDLETARETVKNAPTISRKQKAKYNLV